MKYRIDVFARQYPVLNDFIYYYISYKELFNKIDTVPGNKQFWIRSTDAHLKVAVISWCMIFGTESNPIHWKNVITKENANIYKELRAVILKECDFTDKEWSYYWNQVVGFRNQFIAHREIRFNEPVPYLDKAFRIAIRYDLWIREKIAPDYLAFPTLLKVSNEYKNNIVETLSKI